MEHGFQEALPFGSVYSYYFCLFPAFCSSNSIVLYQVLGLPLFLLS